MATRRFVTGWLRAGRSPQTVDRIRIGVCALIWLVLLGFSVAALVALVDLGRGFHEPAQHPHTGLLYIVIGVSALIILAAIPVLLRARQGTPARPAARSSGYPARGAAPARPSRRAPTGAAPARPSRRAPTGAAPARPSRQTPSAGVQGPVARRTGAAASISGSDDEVDRAVLAVTTELASIAGIALIAVAAATYLMTIGKDGAAWGSYGVAGFIAAAMPVPLWRHLR